MDFNSKRWVRLAIVWGSISGLFAGCTSTHHSGEVASQPGLPYPLDSIPGDWVKHQNRWFEFYLPPGWRSHEWTGIDSYIGEIYTDDEKLVIQCDDINFGWNPYEKWGNNSMVRYALDSVDGERVLYSVTADHYAAILLFNGYQMFTTDSLTQSEFEKVCQIFQTFQLRKESYGDYYLKTYKNGRYYAPEDPFMDRIYLVSYFLEDLGFVRQKEKVLTELSDLSAHWWLQVFTKHYRWKTDSLLYPTHQDWQSIQSIRQVEFTKQWKFVFEEWQFKDSQDAQKWLEVVLATKHFDDRKPPRIFWIKDHKLYFIVATAAKDWMEHGEKITERFAERKIPLIRLFNQPLEVKTYKKAKRGANSGTLLPKPYFYQPPDPGLFYEYFWFYELRPKFPQESFDGLRLKTYIHDQTIGTYEDVSESFIGIKSRLEDPDLRLLNLVGKTEDYLTQTFGFQSVAGRPDYIIEWYGRDVLIIHLKGHSSGQRVVEWFNFIRTGLDFRKDSLPEELWYFDEQIPGK